MIGEKLIRFATSIIISGSHLAAFFQLQEIISEIPLAERWRSQSLILLCISLVLSLTIQFLKNVKSRWVFFSLLVCLIIVIGMPLGPHLSVELTLLFSLILLSSVSLSLSGSISLSLLGISIIILVQKQVNAWGFLIPAPSANNLMALGIISIGFTAVCNLSRHFQQRLCNIIKFRQSVDEAYSSLVQVNLQLQEYAALSGEEAIITERKRLARDLHDTLAYTLTNVIMMMEAGIDLVGLKNNKLNSLLERARDEAIDGLEEVRQVIQAIRPKQLNKTTGLRAVYQLVKAFEKATHIQTTLHLRDSPWNFGKEEDIIIYRLVQEGITNALRHGNAKHISIFFSCENEGIRVSVEDDGIGFTELKEGYGIIGMRERIEKLSGNLDIISKPKAGTLLSMWLPIKTGNADGQN